MATKRKPTTKRTKGAQADGRAGTAEDRALSRFTDEVRAYHLRRPPCIDDEPPAAPRLGEPEELRVWRAIIERWDWLTSNVHEGEDAADLLGETAPDNTLFRDALDALVKTGDAARRELEEIDQAIRERPSVASMPRELADRPRRRKLLDAMAKVVLYLALRDLRQASEYMAGTAASLAIVALSRVSETLRRDVPAWVDPQELESLIAGARSQMGDSYKTLEATARYVVANVAGLSPDSRWLRDAEKTLREKRNNPGDQPLAFALPEAAAAQAQRRKRARRRKQ